MRNVLAAVALGAAVLVPVSSASASAICVVTTEDGHQVCVGTPCPADALNKVDEKLGDHLSPFGCPT